MPSGREHRTVSRWFSHFSCLRIAWSLSPHPHLLRSAPTPDFLIQGVWGGIGNHISSS